MTSRRTLLALLLAPAVRTHAAVADSRFPNVPLLTHDGTRLMFYDDLIKGKVVLLNFFYTSCTSICPRTTANLVKVEEALGDRLGREVRIISISVDPDKDTPAALTAYARRFATKPGWYFVTGRGQDIDLLKRRFGVDRYGNDRIDHTGILVYGNEATAQWASTPAMGDPDAIARSVTRLVRK